MSWVILFTPDAGFGGIIAFLFILAVISFPIGAFMCLLQLFSGEKIKFFGLKPGEPIYDATRHW